MLHNFGSGTDGYWPWANLILDAAGNLYSTTFQGGTHSVGTVFEVTPASGGRWTEQVLHNFEAHPTGPDSSTGPTPRCPTPSRSPRWPS